MLRDRRKPVTGSVLLQETTTIAIVISVAIPDASSFARLNQLGERNRNQDHFVELMTDV
jgi:hypothetical protein